MGAATHQGAKGQLKTYRLYVQLAGRWQWLCDIKAESHAQAFKEAMLCLQPEHYDKPIRLEQDPVPGTASATGR